MVLRRPTVGDHAPDFTLSDTNGELVTLSALLAGSGGAVVLYFYPRDETWGCTAEACAFRDSYQDFVHAGAAVVGVSRDDPASHARFIAKHQLPFTLLSDPTGEVHARYGIRAGRLVKDRVTFVMDSSGIVRHTFKSQVRFHAHVARALEVARVLADQASSAAPMAPATAAPG